MAACRPPWILVENVYKRYGRTWALRGISLSIEDAGVHVLYGHNGSGKSTLIRLISGLTRPTKGKIRVCGYDPSILPGRVLKRLALGIEGSMFPPHLTGRDLARSIARERRAGFTGIERVAGELGVTSYWDRMLFTYSMGMRKRLLLAITLGLALDNEASILILDEPYTLLDPRSREIVSNLILEAARNMPAMIATHLITEAEENGETLYHMSQGQIIEVLVRAGSPVLRCPYTRDVLDTIEREGYARLYVDKQTKTIIVEKPGRVPKGCVHLLRPRSEL